MWTQKRHNYQDWITSYQSSQSRLIICNTILDASLSSPTNISVTLGCRKIGRSSPTPPSLTYLPADLQVGEGWRRRRADGGGRPLPILLQPRVHFIIRRLHQDTDGYWHDLGTVGGSKIWCPPIRMGNLGEVIRCVGSYNHHEGVRLGTLTYGGSSNFATTHCTHWSFLTCQIKFTIFIMTLCTFQGNSVDDNAIIKKNMLRIIVGSSVCEFCNNVFWWYPCSSSELQLCDQHSNQSSYLSNERDKLYPRGFHRWTCTRTQVSEKLKRMSWSNDTDNMRLVPVGLYGCYVDWSIRQTLLV